MHDDTLDHRFICHFLKWTQMTELDHSLLEMNECPFRPKTHTNIDTALELCYPPTSTMLPTITFGQKYCASSQRAQHEIQEQCSHSEEQATPNYKHECNMITLS